MLWQKYKKVSLDDLFYVFNKHHMIHFYPMEIKAIICNNECTLAHIYI